MSGEEAIIIRHGECGGSIAWAGLKGQRGRRVKRWLMKAARNGDQVEVYNGPCVVAPICKCGRTEEGP